MVTSTVALGLFVGPAVRLEAAGFGPMVAVGRAASSRLPTKGVAVYGRTSLGSSVVVASFAVASASLMASLVLVADVIF